MAGESDISWTVGAQLAHAEGVLASAGTTAPRQEAVTLLSALLDVPSTLLLAQSERRLCASAVETFAAWTARRAAGEAVSHITRHVAFMGLDLTITPEIPLPWRGAQRLVEVALEFARHRAPGELAVAELGTGCGAIALALAAFEPRFARIYALDSSLDALATAQANGARYLLNLVISWMEGAGLDAVPEPVDLIIRGPEGDTGASDMAGLLEQARAKLRPGGALICGLDGTQGQHPDEPLALASEGAQMWVDRTSHGIVVAIAQFIAHPPSDG